MEEITVLKIVDKISMQYQKLGLLIGLSVSEIEGFRERSFLNTEKTCNFIFDAWVSKNGHSPNYPLSWEGLYALLKDIGHKQAADDMKQDLARKGVKV